MSAEALKEKELGNAAYKNREFDKAIEHYQKAIDLDATDITFYTNMAAVHFEKKNFEDVLKWCEKAIDVGRENQADFKLIAKAMLRAANAYKELGELYKAKAFYEKSLAEHRTPATKEALSVVEKLIKEKERLDYIDPKLAEDAKAKGNEFFSAGNFSEAVKHYSEAIKRNPDDAKLYSNRAAAYTKLMAFDYALKGRVESRMSELNQVQMEPPRSNCM
jgi:tetratricopeptide (TPR) repeat protein